jgi:hypothetical protein
MQTLLEIDASPMSVVYPNARRAITVESGNGRGWKFMQVSLYKPCLTATTPSLPTC